MKRERKIIFMDGDFRIVAIYEHSYHIEKHVGADAMGVPQWSQVARCDWQNSRDALDGIELPENFTRAILHRLADHDDAQARAEARGRREALALAETIVAQCEVGPETEDLRTLILNELRGLQ